MVLLGNELRRRNINYSSSHIPEFSEQIDSHLHFAEEALKKQISEDKDERTTIFKDFIKEANEKKQNNQVTYKWWVLFNFRLSILLTPSDKRTTLRANQRNPFIEILYKENAWIKESELENINESYLSSLEENIINLPRTIFESIQLFPNHIIIPTTLGIIGVKSFNSRFLTGINPFGLIRSKVTGDGIEMYPDNFWGHDEVHFVNELIALNDITSKEKYLQFQNQLFHYINKLPVEKQIQLEFIYFLLTHEYGFFLNYLLIKNSEHYTTKTISEYQLTKLVNNCMSSSWYKNLIPSSISTNETLVRNYILESVSLFNKLAIEINLANN